MTREYIVRVGGKEYTVTVTEVAPGKFKVKVDSHELEVEAPITQVATPTQPVPQPVVEEKRRIEEKKPSETVVEAPRQQPPMPTAKPEVPKAPPTGGTVVEAPVPGKILKVLVKPGQKVTKTTVLLTLESMKMELEVYPPRDGVVREIRVNPGDFVNSGDPLVILE